MNDNLNTFFKEKLIWFILGFLFGIIAIPVTYLIDRKRADLIPVNALNYEIKGVVFAIIIYFVRLTLA